VADFPVLEAALTTDPSNVPEVYEVDGVLPVMNPHRQSKAGMLVATPLSRSIYIDSDVRMLADLSEVLKRFDIAEAHTHSRKKATTTEILNIDLPMVFWQFNDGRPFVRLSSA
jgi:hypothetical protein